MMMMSRLLTRASLAAAMLMVLLMPGRADAQTIDDIVKRGTITIGVVSGVPPFGILDTSGNPAGYDVDVATLVGKYLGVKVALVPLTPPSRVPALQTHKVDVLIATLAPTPERAKNILFTMPYSAFQMSIAAPKGFAVKTLQDLAGKKVAVPRGSPQDVAITRLAMPQTQIVRFEDDATCVQAVLSGQTDAAGLPNTVVAEINKTQPAADIEFKFAFSQQPNSMALNKDQTDLRQWLNNFIYFVKLNGELDAISRKWIGQPLPELPVF